MNADETLSDNVSADQNSPPNVLSNGNHKGVAGNEAIGSSPAKQQRSGILDGPLRGQGYDMNTMAAQAIYMATVMVYCKVCDITMDHAIYRNI